MHAVQRALLTSNAGTTLHQVLPGHHSASHVRVATAGAGGRAFTGPSPTTSARLFHRCMAAHPPKQRPSVHGQPEPASVSIPTRASIPTIHIVGADNSLDHWQTRSQRDTAHHRLQTAQAFTDFPVRPTGLLRTALP
jgi:hypothetical protein